MPNSSAYIIDKGCLMWEESSLFQIIKKELLLSDNIFEKVMLLKCNKSQSKILRIVR